MIFLEGHVHLSTLFSSICALGRREPSEVLHDKCEKNELMFIIFEENTKKKLFPSSNHSEKAHNKHTPHSYLTTTIRS